MKKILYLTFYFEPDLSACAFRNTPLVKELARQAEGKAEIDVITTMPNRYASFDAQAPELEHHRNHLVRRIPVPAHQSGMKDQVLSYKSFYLQVKKWTKNKSYDLVIASSAKLFTGYLGYVIAKKKGIPLYLDIRDLFHENLEDILDGKALKRGVLPLIELVENKTFAYAAHINLISEGFKPNFERYKNPNYTYFSNGIDPLFADNDTDLARAQNKPYTIVYAGNVGEGQGLHRIIPQAAKALGDGYRFTIIGDGGKKAELVQKIKEFGLTNVSFRDPVKREELKTIYRDCDFTFVHLNDYDAFKKVLPSKIFELACFPQPLLAGVSGYAEKFVAQHVNNKILFSPCDVDSLVNQLQNFVYKRKIRSDFIGRFGRASINVEMANSMLSYL